MENQIELNERIHKNWNRYRELFPGLADGYDAMTGNAYAGGRLDAKTKRLIAIAIAVTHGCRGCMLSQTGHALNMGADAEEILEACAVSLSIGGTMAAAEVTRVVEYLEELGKL